MTESAFLNKNIATNRILIMKSKEILITKAIDKNERLRKHLCLKLV